MEKIRKIDLVHERSESVQEILTRLPNWVVLWGSTLIFTLITLFFLASWFIQYPDVIQAKIKITTQSPPGSLIARSSGKLMNMKVADNQKVQINSALAVIDNSANEDHVFYLIGALSKVDTSTLWNHSENLVQSLDLGDLQQEYSDYLKAANAYNFFKKFDPISQMIKLTKVQIERNQQFYEKQAKQITTCNAQLKLAQSDYNRNKHLYQDKVISLVNLEESESKLLETQSKLERAELDMATVQIQLSELEKELINIHLQNEKEKISLKAALLEAFGKLQSATAAWEEKYVLKAPVSGKVTFFKYWSDHQFVKEGEEVMTIVPSEEGQQLVGKVIMPLQNSGKVALGQRVNIRLDNYPYQEFGMVKGIVKNVALVPRDGTYAIEVSLPDNLRTNYYKQLVFKQELQGSAEIITEDMQLLERIFYSLRSATRNVGRTDH